MVCWAVNDEKAVLDSATALSNKMEVQPNAKKCKFQDQSEMELPCLPADPCPEMRPFCHQVGGHTQFLQLDQSTVCKPLIPRELSFYLNAPADICTFTPKCKGVIQTWHQEGRQYWKRFAMDEISVTADHSEISSNTRHDAPLRISLAGHEAISYHPAHTYTDGSSQFFMMLENVASASKFERPCVLDLKMGTRQHGDDASAEKRNRQMAKCAASTSASLGLRLCGMKVYEATSDKFFVQDKYFGRRLDADGLRKALVQFFASGGARRAGIIGAILERLRLLRKAIEQQDTFRFYSSSLLIVYEGCDEHCEFFLGRDYHFLTPPLARRSSEPESTDVSCYKPARCSSDAQIPRLNEVAIPSQVSIADTNDCYLTDSCETQSFGTSPQSVDSGLDCLMMEQASSLSSTNECCWKGVNGQGRYKPILKNSSTSYECDNSTDSTDSGVFSLPMVKQQFKKLKKQSTTYTDSEEESDVMWLEDGQQVSMELSGEEDGELTPVLEVSRTEEFTANGSQDKPNPAKADNCWADCVDVRMIDFAHTTFSGYLGLDERVHWGPDNGYLFGLENLTDILSELQGFSAHQRNALSY
ncbi:inositol hexakisphosphate kinase 1-like [Daphnia carinata]|uniref:inositol hexakisphosphate kinase 1-like n=1 Tax=Daphnia carinata TaxID=120202 RepID=UPI00257A5DDC|nr:inositol hexakisphosphate kinase 1-like [Daphnia carinata]